MEKETHPNNMPTAKLWNSLSFFPFSLVMLLSLLWLCECCCGGTFRTSFDLQTVDFYSTDYKNKQSTNEMGLKITRFGKIICANISFNIGPFSVISNLRCICLPSKTSTINRKNWVVSELCPTPTNNTADIKWHGCLFGVLSTVAVKERKMLLTFLPDFRIKSSP